jgi:MarR family transcriptional regulator, negative regulator of the multidrug operon emrRAB
MSASTQSRTTGVAGGRLANTFGALALAITDDVMGQLSRRYFLGPSDAAALVVLSRAPQRIEDVSQQLRLSHSATVRLVDRLEAGGLAARSPGRDARSVNVRLTPAGKRRARAVLAERDRLVDDILTDLSSAERELLAGVFERLLEQLGVDWETTMQVCRLCDIPACEAKAPCPIALGAERNSGKTAAEASLSRRNR